MKSKLSVVICTFNRAYSLKNCLSSLAKQTFTNFEVVIIDGGSTDETSKVINQYAKTLKIRKFVNLEKELARARDQGWRKAKGKLVAWIDDDVVVSKSWAKAVIEILERNPDVGGVTGPTIIPQKLRSQRDIFFFYNKKGVASWLGWFWNQFFLEGGKYKVGRIFKSGAWSPGSNFPACLKVKGLKEIDYLEACNMSLRKDLIAKVGGFDYAYRGVAEWSELDLAIRIKKLGYRLVFSTKAKVHHYISRGGVFPRRTQAQQRMENFLRFYFTHIFKPKPDYLGKFLAYLLFLNLYWGYKAVTTKNHHWLGGWVGTITGLVNYVLRH